MGERELLLVMAAMMFFSTTNLSVNRFILYNNEAIMENEIEYYAISMAQRIIEEAKTRKFDLFAPPQDFTAPWSLGPANYESYPLVNDVDDYHRFDRTINTPQGPYRVQVQVYYVEETNIDHIVSHRTNYKKMTVTVTSDYLSHPIVLNHVFSYISNG